MVHVDFETGKEHQVEKPHLAENGKRRIVVEDVEPVRPDYHTGNNHAYDVGDFELVEQQRRKEDDSQHDKEYLHRLCHQGLRERYHLWSSIYCAICTALRAAPLRIWSATVQNDKPLGSARSARTRPTYTGSLPATKRGIG